MENPRKTPTIDRFIKKHPIFKIVFFSCGRSAKSIPAKVNTGYQKYSMTTYKIVVQQSKISYEVKTFISL
jgi:hypothetical protein